ncbi:MAG: thioredoxin domain-containing protein [Candidatus Binatia bacterium]
MPAALAAVIFAAGGLSATCLPTSAGEGDFLATALPGAIAHGPDLVEKLTKKWEARHSDYKPRTKHLREDGSPKYTNRLFLTSSPYLLQHAHNPVNWYPWGDEAFDRASKLGRPVLLSVGYSTCHWCHVMEEESFEDEEIARFLNEHYIAIKVDREERPDVDAIYMSAVQALTGGGGWPMTVWLTPDRKPFYGGTYFPARDGDRGTRVGFLTLLASVGEVYARDPGKALESSASLTAHIRQRLAPPAGAGDLPGIDVLRFAAGHYENRFDAAYGGTSGAPKFPSNLPIRFLLRYHRRGGGQKALEMATTTLEKMAAGGMYDQVGGGFHRYSTDARWLVPHFEKMLYDNALLAVAYLEAHQATGREDFARVVREILRYVEREMTSPDGAFYSATDADSLTPSGHREEGWFFTWTPAEVDAVLDAEQARVVKAYYAVTDGGNFEGRNILNTPQRLDEVANQLKLSPERMRELLEAAKARLYQARTKRPAPLRDDKILVAWNGLMISAYARAAETLNEPRYAAIAERAAGFVLGNMRANGRLLRSHKDGAAQHNAYLDDYAFFIAALLDLYETTGDTRWLREAVALDDVLARHYEDEQGGGFFMTSDDHEELLAREKPGYDGAEPSGNSVQALNLLRLHELTTNDAYRKRAERTLKAFGTILGRAPAALSEMLLAVDFLTDAPKEIIIVAPESRSEARPFLDHLRANFLPNRVVVVVPESALQAHIDLVPLVEGKVAQDGRTTAYVCERRVCELPTSDPATFAKQIAKVKPLNQHDEIGQSVP